VRRKLKKNKLKKKKKIEIEEDIEDKKEKEGERVSSGVEHIFNLRRVKEKEDKNVDHDFRAFLLMQKENRSKEGGDKKNICVSEVVRHTRLSESLFGRKKKN